MKISITIIQTEREKEENIMKGSGSISLTIIPVQGTISRFSVEIKDNATINDLIQTIKNRSPCSQALWNEVDGRGQLREAWHLFCGRNLYNPLASLGEYNIKDGSTIDILPGNRARDLVPKYFAPALADLLRAERLSIRSERVRVARVARAALLFTLIQRRVCDVPDEPS